MSTDREVLELAAKAAGLRGTWNREVACIRLQPGKKTPYGTTYTYWDPLADDGDALRLAVKLNMTLRCYMGNTCAQIGVPNQPNVYSVETNHADPAAATRHVIVRAAAEIGKAMS